MEYHETALWQQSTFFRDAKNAETKFENFAPKAKKEPLEKNPVTFIISLFFFRIIGVNYNIL